VGRAEQHMWYGTRTGHQTEGHHVRSEFDTHRIDESILTIASHALISVARRRDHHPSHLNRLFARVSHALCHPKP